MNEGQIKDGHVLESHFAGFLAQCLKGTHSERADIVCLLSQREAGYVSVKNLYKVILLFIIQAYVSCRVQPLTKYPGN